MLTSPCRSSRYASSRGTYIIDNGDNGDNSGGLLKCQDTHDGKYHSYASAHDGTFTLKLKYVEPTHIALEYTQQRSLNLSHSYSFLHSRNDPHGVERECNFKDET